MATFLHTCYRIGDIERSVGFYEKLGFEEVRRMPIGDEAINVFMAMPGEDPRLELTYNHGVTDYDHGTGYNHIASGSTTSTEPSPSWPTPASSPKSRPTAPAAAPRATASASSGTPTATASS